MAILAMLLLLTWTILLVRALGLRTTLSLRTLAVAFAFGAVGGPLLVITIFRFFNTYGGGSPGYVALVNTAMHLALLLPLGAVFSIPALRRGASIADGFLAAFCAGLGYDMIASLLLAPTMIGFAHPFSWLPPAVPAANELHLAGFAYWNGLTALLFAAAYRFTRSPLIAWLAGGSVALFGGFSQAAFYASTDGAVGWSTFLLRHDLFAWLTLLLVVIFSIIESQWEGAAGGKSFQFLSDLQSWLTALAGMRRAEAEQLALRVRLRRQHALAAAEAKRGPLQPGQAEFLKQLEAGLRAAEGAAAPARTCGSCWTQWAVALLALLALWILPWFGPDKAAWFWNAPLIHLPLPPFNALTVLGLLLAGLLGYRYLCAPPAPFTKISGDETARFTLEKRLLEICLALLLLALVISGAPQDFLNLNGSLNSSLNQWAPNWSGAPLLTVALLLAALASGLTLRRAAKWRTASLHARRGALVRQLRTLATLIVLAFAAQVFLMMMQAQIHQRWGAELFNSFQGHGNSVGDFIAGIFTLLFVLLLALPLRKWGRQAELFLTASAPAIGTKR